MLLSVDPFVCHRSGDAYSDISRRSCNGGYMTDHMLLCHHMQQSLARGQGLSSRPIRADDTLLHQSLTCMNWILTV